MEEEKDIKPVKKNINEEECSKLKRSNEKKKATIVILIFALVIAIMLSLLFYFTLDNGNSKGDSDKTTTNCNCETAQNSETTACNCPKCTSDLGEKLSSLKKVDVTEKNQTIKVGKKEYKVRRDSEYKLFIDDDNLNNVFGDPASIDNGYLYLTDKFMFVTSIGQFNEFISFALGENGEIVINNNDNQMADFKLVDGYLHATGGVAYDDGNEMVVKSKDLFIKYIDNTLIVK